MNRKSAGVIIILIVAVSGFTYLGTQFSPNTSGNGKEIVVIAKQFEFIPYRINATLGEKITLYISSIDVTHGFEIPEFGVYNQQIANGQNTTITIDINQIGEFKFYCTVFCGVGHSDHYGYLVVTEQ